MELAILIAAVVGIVVFAACFLKFAYEGFKHHPAVALMVAAGTWFAGAGKTFNSTLNPAVSSSSTASTSSGADSSGVVAPVQDKHLSTLPSKALYRLDFESAPPNNIKSFVGRVVRITNANLETTDGRIQSVTPGSVFIEQSGADNVAYEMMLSNIKSIEVMVKRAAR